MMQWSCVRMPVVVVISLIIGVMACDTYSYLPTRTKTIEASPTGPPGAAPAPAPAQGTAAAPAPAGAPPDLAQQVQDLQFRVQQLESRLKETEAQRRKYPPPPARAEDSRPAQVAHTKTKAPAAAASAAGDKLYAEGLHLYQAKKYAAARGKFAQYLKSHSQGPKAPEARYYLGDSFYLEGKYYEAAVELNKMAKQYPQHLMAPAAMLRQALAYKGENQPQNYRLTLRKLIQSYPKTPEAQEAQKQLKEGKKEPKKEVKKEIKKESKPAQSGR